MYQYGDTVTIQAEEVALISPFWHPLTPFTGRTPSGPWKLRTLWPPRFLHGSLFRPGSCHLSAPRWRGATLFSVIRDWSVLAELIRSGIKDGLIAAIVKAT